MISIESKTAVTNGLCSKDVNEALEQAGYPIYDENPCYRTVYTPYSEHDWREVVPHADAMRWLRNVKHISIDVVTCYEEVVNQPGNRTVSDEVTGYSYIVHETDYQCLGDDQRCVTHLIQHDEKSVYETFEEACEEALKWVLTNLI